MRQLIVYLFKMQGVFLFCFFFTIKHHKMIFLSCRCWKTCSLLDWHICFWLPFYTFSWKSVFATKFRTGLFLKLGFLSISVLFPLQIVGGAGVKVGTVIYLVLVALVAPYCLPSLCSWAAAASGYFTTRRRLTKRGKQLSLWVKHWSHIKIIKNNKSAVSSLDWNLLRFPSTIWMET